MNPTRDDLMRTYSAMSDDELMDVAEDYADLTPEAQDAIRAEFAQRKLEPPVVEDDDAEPVQLPEGSDDTVVVATYADAAAAQAALDGLRYSYIPAGITRGSHGDAAVYEIRVRARDAETARERVVRYDPEFEDEASADAPASDATTESIPS